MKKSLSILLLFISSIVFSQENSIKSGFTDALTGHFNLSYERAVNAKSSVAFKIGYWQPTASPLISKNTITPEAYEIIDAKGGINTSVEYRFYMGGNMAPDGFYVAPYFRFFNQAALYTDEIDGDLFDVDMKLNTFGLGAQIGYQLIVEGGFTMDFYFFGGGVDRYNLNLDYRLQQPQAGFDYSTITDDVGDVFEDINYLDSRLEHEVNDTNLLSKLPFLFPGFRIGINVGYSF